MDILSLLIVIIIMSSIWVAFDAHNLHVKKGHTTGLLDIGVAGWFFSCLFLWLLAFPVYLANRKKLRFINASSPTPTPFEHSVFSNLPIREIEPTTPGPRPPGVYSRPSQNNDLQFEVDRRAALLLSINTPSPANAKVSPDSIIHNTLVAAQHNASRPSTLLRELIAATERNTAVSRDLLAAQQDTAATLLQIRNAIAFSIILAAITALLLAIF